MPVGITFWPLVHLTRNENLKKDYATTTSDLGTSFFFFKTKMTGFRRASLAFFSLLQERLHEPDEIIRDEKDDILVFIFLEEHNNKTRLLKILKFGRMPKPREQFHECRIRLLSLFPPPCNIIRTTLAQMERKSVTNPNDPRSKVDCLDCNLRLVCA